jgi:molybdenum cofactor cytidylyltransferase
VKSAPFAVARTELEAVLNILKERGPILQARPIRRAPVAVLYSDPATGERARVLFDSIMRQRLERIGANLDYSLAVVEEAGSIARSLQQLTRCRPAVILVASTTAPACPEDTVGCALQQIGCHMERFMAPVEPGNLLLLAYKDEIPILCAPGCYRSAKPNVVDLMLPPLLARYRVTGWEVACLGHGGLLG